MSLLVLAIAAAALVALVTSALTGAGLVLGAGRLAARTPAAQARILLVMAVVPALATFAVMAAALAPSFGWIADHCLPAGDPHGHPHLCPHHAGVGAALPLVVLAVLFVARAALVGGQVARAALEVLVARRTLARSARRAGRVRVLPIAEPQAFTLGVLRPALFVTRGLVAVPNRAHLRSVLAHERAHLRRNDSLRRLTARLAFAFHLPGIAAAIEWRLARAHEMAADAEAARAVGSRARVARALVDLARAQLPAPASALAFAGSHVVARVEALLDGRRQVEGPGAVTLAAVAAAALLAVAGGADLVHHGLEIALGLFGG